MECSWQTVHIVDECGYIARAVGLDDFEEAVFDYFRDNMADNIFRLQGSTGPLPAVPSGLNTQPVQSLDEMGMEIIKCCKGRDLKEVCVISKTGS